MFHEWLYSSNITIFNANLDSSNDHGCKDTIPLQMWRAQDINKFNCYDLNRCYESVSLHNKKFHPFTFQLLICHIVIEDRLIGVPTTNVVA